MDSNDRLMRIAQQMNTQDQFAGLQASLGRLNAIQSKSLMVPENAKTALQDNLVMLQKQIAQYLSTQNQSLLPYITKQQQKVAGNLLMFSPEGFFPDVQYHATQSAVLQRLLSQINPAR